MSPVVYEVTVAVDAAAADAYAAWLRGHIPEVVAAGGFLGADWYAVADAPADGRTHWTIQYRAPGQDALDAYLAGPAVPLRADAQARFGGRFEARRRVLVPVG